jgi:hypothetical protein
MARVIVRFSLDGDDGTDTTNAGNALRARGVPRASTGLYQGYGDVPQLTAALRALLDVLDTPTRGNGLDHLWVYIDRQTD